MSVVTEITIHPSPFAPKKRKGGTRAYVEGRGRAEIPGIFSLRFGSIFAAALSDKLSYLNFLNTHLENFPRTDLGGGGNLLLLRKREQTKKFLVTAPSFLLSFFPSY